MTSSCVGSTLASDPMAELLSTTLCCVLICKELLTVSCSRRSWLQLGLIPHCSWLHGVSEQPQPRWCQNDLCAVHACDVIVHLRAVLC